MSREPGGRAKEPAAGIGETTRDAGAGLPEGHPERAPPRPFDGRRAVRWLLVVPAGLLGWYSGIVAGVLLLTLAESFCPPDQMVSELCSADWFDLAATVAVNTGVAVAAALVVLLPTLTAPSFRGTVAWTAFTFGAAVAGNLAWLDDAWIEMLVAVTVGFVVLVASLRRWRADGRARPRQS